MVQESDETMAIKVQAGDKEAFGFLIERYEDKLKRYGRKFLNTKEDIEDIVQEVFIKAYTHIQSYDSTQRFSPWVYRIAHNQFVNELRKKSRQPLGFFDPDTILPFVTASETTDGPLEQEELKKMMEEFLDEVASKYREPLVLFFYEELSYQDISEVLHIPVTTVGVRIKRGKEKLKALYTKKNVWIT